MEQKQEIESERERERENEKQVEHVRRESRSGGLLAAPDPVQQM